MKQTVKTLVGSNANNGLNTRPLYLNVNNDSGLSNVNVGTRTLYDTTTSTVLTSNVEYTSSLCVGTETEDSEDTRL